jgi:hypothetical protein
VPADRFASAAEFVRALEVTSTAAPRVRRAPLARYAIAAGVVAVAAALWLVSGGLHRSAEHVTLTDRKQVTFTGAVRNPAVSGDGTQIAYAVTNCRASGCTYAIDIQDVGGTTTRRVFDGATALYDVEWSRDRRNILFEGSINGAYGEYLVSTLGGAPRRITPAVATFRGNDSLLFVNHPHPHPDYWIYVAGFDAAPRDSIRLPGVGEALQGIVAIPASKWIVVRFQDHEHSIWLSLDRAGREGARVVTPIAQNMSASADAVWMRFRSGASSQQPIVARMAFDASNGHFATSIDTLYRLGARDNDFSVTSDGATLMFGEGTTEYDVFAGDFRDAIAGTLPKDRAILHTTVAPHVFISPDGARLLVGRVDGSTTGEWRWSVMPTAGGSESTISGGGVGSTAYWTDAVTIAMREHSSQGWRMSLLDVRTNARRALLTIPDSTTEDEFSPLPNGGWAWVAPGGRSIALQGPGQPSPVQLAVPPWYATAFRVGASTDGHRLGLVGWSAPSGDSIGLSVLSSPDGREARWSTTFGEDAGFDWLADGSILFYIQATADTYTLERIRGPGQVEHLGSVPRPISGITVSRDLRRMSVITRDQHGDAWSMRVVKR